MGQPNRYKTRTRRQVDAAAIATGTEPLPEAVAACCEPITVGHFKDQRLIAVYRRHVGPRCAPLLEATDVRKWRAERGLR